MSMFKQLKENNFESIRDLQISLFIHLIVLILLTVYFALINKEVLPKNKLTVPVKLVAPVNKIKLGSGIKNKPVEGSKKSEGTTNKLVKPDEKKPVLPIQKEIKKEETKPVAAKAEEKTKIKEKSVSKSKNDNKIVNEKKKTEKKEKENTIKPTSKNKSQTSVKKNISKTSNNKSQVIPQKAKETAKQTVIQKPKETKTAVIKPTHIKPTFEDKGDISITPAMNTELLSEVADSMLSVEPENIFEPGSIFKDDLPETIPESLEQPQTGVQETSKGEAGLFEIGTIEAFGGSNEVFSPPSILKRVMPEYPEWARKEGVHGSAVYRVLILPSGTVGDVVTMSSTVDPKLALTGSQALRRWVFTPVLINGEPQETWVKLTVQYELN